MELRGIDVSKWNGNIDWAKVRASGIDFVMVKAANGSNKGTYSLDPKFDFNIRGAYDAGLYCGVYLYSYAKTPAAASEEAKFLTANLEPYRKMITFPVAYDLEDVTQMGLGKSVCGSMVKSFCDVIRNAGYKPILYTNPSWLSTYVNAPSDVQLWLARWYTKEPGRDCAMWQYTDKGRVSGIGGSVDMDVCYVNYAKEENSVNLPNNEHTLKKPVENASSWANESWKRAASAGVLDGTNPKGAVTREQLAVILDRLGLLK